jgi:hypothetical protein
MSIEKQKGRQQERGKAVTGAFFKNHLSNIREERGPILDIFYYISYRSYYGISYPKIPYVYHLVHSLLRMYRLYPWSSSVTLHALLYI